MIANTGHSVPRLEKMLISYSKANPNFLESRPNFLTFLIYISLFGRAEFPSINTNISQERAFQIPHFFLACSAQNARLCTSWCMHGMGSRSSALPQWSAKFPYITHALKSESDVFKMCTHSTYRLITDVSFKRPIVQWFAFYWSTKKLSWIINTTTKRPFML